MENIKGLLGFFSKNIISVLGVAVLTGATVTTSALGLVKVGNSISATNLEVPRVQETSSSSESSVTSSSSSTSSTGGSRPVGSAGKTGASQTPSAAQSGTSSSAAPQSNTASGCIVTLFGKQYDVTSLQNSHSGGNVFVCGTDQTALYQSQHGSNVSRMQQYLVTSGGTTGSTTGNTGGSSVSGGSTGSRFESEDDGKDEDHEEEIEIEHEEEEEREHDELESSILFPFRSSMA